MGTKIEVDFEALNTLIDSMVTERNGLSDGAAAFRAAGQHLLTQWEGEAAEAFQVAQEGWLADNQVTIDELTAAITRMTTVTANYQSAESHIIGLCQ